MSATTKAREFAASLTTDQIIDALDEMQNPSDHGVRVIFAVLAAEACKRLNLEPRKVATAPLGVAATLRLAAA